jgi:hypothetical protein
VVRSARPSNSLLKLWRWQNVAEAGGKVLGEPIEIPGIGQYVLFVDTEDNRVSMLQPIPRNNVC